MTKPHEPEPHPRPAHQQALPAKAPAPEFLEAAYYPESHLIDTLGHDEPAFAEARANQGLTAVVMEGVRYYLGKRVQAWIDRQKAAREAEAEKTKAETKHVTGEKR